MALALTASPSASASPRLACAAATAGRASVNAVALRSYANNYNNYTTELQRGEPSALNFNKGYPRAGSGGRSSVSGVTATVLGSTGFLGRYVVNHLGQRGTQIICPYRGDENDWRHLRPCGDVGTIHFREYGRGTAADASASGVQNYDRLCTFFEHSDVVINLAGQEHNHKHHTLYDTNVRGAEMVAKAAAATGVNKLIHVSALNANVASESEFLCTKGAGEEAVLSAFPGATIVRPSDIFGSEDRFLNRLSVERNVPFLGQIMFDDGQQAKTPVYCVDVAKAICQIVTDRHSASLYEFVGPKTYAFKEIVEYISKLQHREHVATNIPFGEFTIPVFQKLAILGELNPFMAPKISRDYVIQQNMSDSTTPGVPGLAEAGVEATAMERVAIGWLRRYRSHAFHDEVNQY